MTLTEICKHIDLQPALTEQVIDFEKNFDFSVSEKVSAGYRDFSKLSDTTNELKSLFAEDTNNVKLLACCLHCACRLYDVYKEKDISDKVFFDTMKCFTRFSAECFEKTGVLAFDRAWWTGRQLGLHLFRIGELEYELVKKDGLKYISVHIPSDAILSYKKTTESFTDAVEFIRKHFPEYTGCEIKCTTWLFSPEIRAHLKDSSRIRIFGDFFDLTITDIKSNDFIKWLFSVENTENYKTLKENTSLQRQMKKFLLEGGSLSVTSGILKKEFCKW